MFWAEKRMPPHFRRVRHGFISEVLPQHQKQAGTDPATPKPTVWIFYYNGKCNAKQNRLDNAPCVQQRNPVGYPPVS